MGRTDVSAALCLPVCEPGPPPHLLRASSISVQPFYAHRFFFGAILNGWGGLLLLFPNSSCLLLVCREAIDFVSKTLLNLHQFQEGFLGRFSGVFYIDSHVICKKRSSFQSVCLLFLFLALTALGRTSSTALTRRGKRRRPCPVLFC